MSHKKWSFLTKSIFLPEFARISSNQIFLKYQRERISIDKGNSVYLESECELKVQLCNSSDPKCAFLNSVCQLLPPSKKKNSCKALTYHQYTPRLSSCTRCTNCPTEKNGRFPKNVAGRKIYVAQKLRSAVLWVSKTAKRSVGGVNLSSSAHVGIKYLLLKP